ncbi:MAG: UbiX family flavin prenyltransferase [Phycisphaerales bacterium]|jgi:4-hydroxy-3-polyprenylbenzoate decarboxylase|nr:UbiX family flavin prenyltransferase [Phycisphaerales bacterium]
MAWEPEDRRIVVGISGASGAPYAVRTIELLALRGVEVHVVASELGRRLLSEECGVSRVTAEHLCGQADPSQVTVHSGRDMGAVVASGSFRHDGMVVVPCSSNTLGALASGITLTLLHRAAMVTLKEGRRLVLAHRETPLSRIDISNMDRLASAGATIAPLAPGFYMQPSSVSDLVDFMAGRLLDHLDIPHELPVRWGE